MSFCFWVCEQLTNILKTKKFKLKEKMLNRSKKSENIFTKKFEENV